MSLVLPLWIYTVIVSAGLIICAATCGINQDKEMLHSACKWILIPFINILRASDYLNSTML